METMTAIVTSVRSAIVKTPAAAESEEEQNMKLKAIPALAMGAVAIYTLETLNVAPSIAAESLVVQTEDGAIQGNVAVGVENFLDIPYAAPPVG